MPQQTDAVSQPAPGMEVVNSQRSRGNPGHRKAHGNPAAAANTVAGAITLVCRAVNLSSVDSSANTDIAYAV